MSYRHAAAAFGSFCALAIVMAGCSSGGTASQAGATATAATATAATTGPAATSAATVVPAATSAAISSQGGLTVSITGLSSRPALAPGGPALEFTVDIKNGTSRTYRDVTPVVAIERCTCVSTTKPPAPAGTCRNTAWPTGSGGLSPTTGWAPGRPT